jgi:hypothetical protein
MSSSWGSLVVGVVGLAVLEGVVSRTQAASNVSGVLAGAGSAIKRFIDPTVPLFSNSPTKTATTASTTTAATSTAGTATTASTASPSSGISVLI